MSSLPSSLFRLLLELIFNVLLNNILTDGRTHDIPAPWAPVGAKKIFNNNDNLHFNIALDFIKFHTPGRLKVIDVNLLKTETTEER